MSSSTKTKLSAWDQFPEIPVAARAAREGRL